MGPSGSGRPFPRVHFLQQLAGQLSSRSLHGLLGSRRVARLGGWNGWRWLRGSPRRAPWPGGCVPKDRSREGLCRERGPWAVPPGGLALEKRLQGLGGGVQAGGVRNTEGSRCLSERGSFGPLPHSARAGSPEVATCGQG